VEPENPDALTLYHDPDRRERLGRNGRAHVEARYTPQVVARQYASLLERTAEGEQGSGGARAFSRVVSQRRRVGCFIVLTTEASFFEMNPFFPCRFLDVHRSQPALHFLRNDRRAG
jgi:hypothetical protein